LKAEDAGGAVTMAGLTFQDKGELAAWMAEAMPFGPFGSYVDFHSLMQQAHFAEGNTDLTAEDPLKALNLRNDLDIATEGDVLVLNVLRTPIPLLLGKGKTPTGSDQTAFFALPSYNDWYHSDGVDGFYRNWPAKLSDAKLAIDADIETRLEEGSIAGMLAQNCLASSITFADGFFLFLDTMYKDLTTSSGFTKKKAWALTTSIGHRICREVHKESGALARSLNLAKGETECNVLCVRMVWAVLRSHKKMAEYVRCQFKDHPTVASEYTKFLATNSGFELVESLQSQLDVFKKELDAIKKSTTMLGNTVDAIKTTANNAKSAAERAEKAAKKG